MTQRHVSGRGATTRRRLLRGLAAGGVAGLAGCVAAPGSSGSELVATLSADVSNYDPTQMRGSTSAKAFGLVYEPLTMVDFEGNHHPELARSIERRGSDRRWRVTLREGVSFHDGSDLTADDVQASFERYEGTPLESDVFRWYASSTVRDERTLDLELKQPFAPLLTKLAYLPIVPAAAATDELSLSEDPVGTGPYRFDRHEPDSFFRVTAFGDHWYDGSGSVPADPPADTVTYRIIGEPSAQLAALRAGDIDIANRPPEGSMESLRNDDAYAVTECLAGAFEFLVFPLGTPPFDDVRVRKGVTRLVPRQRIIDTVYSGDGRPAYAPVSPLLETFSSPSFQREMGKKHAAYDPERARELLEQGFDAAGVEKPLRTRVVTNNHPERARWCQLLRDSLNETEFFDVTLEQFEWTTYSEMVLGEGSHETDAMMALGWSGGWDPDDYVNSLFHSDHATPACCNAAHYSDEAVDRLIERGVSTYDTGERQRIYERLQRKIVGDAPVAFVRFGKWTDAYRADRIDGFRTYPIDGEEYASVYTPSIGAHVDLST